jgi:hypothetical protein
MMDWLLALIYKEARRHTRRRDTLLISIMFSPDGTQFSTSRWVFNSETLPGAQYNRLDLYWNTMRYANKQAAYLHEWEVRAGKEGVW